MLLYLQVASLRKMCTILRQFSKNLFWCVLSPDQRLLLNNHPLTRSRSAAPALLSSRFFIKRGNFRNLSDFILMLANILLVSAVWFRN